MASDVAPPGGCRQRSQCMAKIASATASAAATKRLGMNMKQVIPISAETMWPPMNDHGCAIGLCGAANSSTDDAPMEAIMSGSALCPRLALRMPVSRMPTKAEIAETSFSL